MLKRTLAMVLTVIMVLSLLPVGVLAATPIGEGAYNMTFVGEGNNFNNIEYQKNINTNTIPPLYFNYDGSELNYTATVKKEDGKKYDIEYYCSGSLEGKYIITKWEIYDEEQGDYVDYKDEEGNAIDPKSVGSYMLTVYVSDDGNIKGA